MIKKNIFLYLAILIPIIMILCTVIVVQFSLINIKPKFNFIYATIETNNAYYCERQLLSKLFPSEYPKTIIPSTLHKAQTDCKNIHYYIYDSNNSTSAPITLEQFTKFTLTRGTSPDGYKFAQYCRASLPVGWNDSLIGDNIGGVCIIKDTTEQRIKVEKPFRFGTYVFLGWLTNPSTHQGIKP